MMEYPFMCSFYVDRRVEVGYEGPWVWTGQDQDGRWGIIAIMAYSALEAEWAFGCSIRHRSECNDGSPALRYFNACRMPTHWDPMRFLFPMHPLEVRSGYKWPYSVRPDGQVLRFFGGKLKGEAISVTDRRLPPTWRVAHRPKASASAFTTEPPKPSECSVYTENYGRKRFCLTTGSTRYIWDFYEVDAPQNSAKAIRWILTRFLGIPDEIRVEDQDG